MRKKGSFAFFTAMALCAAAGTASATVFYIDEFTVTENGQTYWRTLSATELRQLTKLPQWSM